MRVNRPSIYLSELADGMEGLADKVEEFEGRISGLKVWRYPGLMRKLEALEADKRLLLDEYRKLSILYEEKTGEKAPLSPTVFIMSTTEGLAEGLRSLLGSFAGFGG